MKLARCTFAKYRCVGVIPSEYGPKHVDSYLNIRYLVICKCTDRIGQVVRT